jgi:hypothetical protein
MWFIGHGGIVVRNFQIGRPRAPNCGVNPHLSIKHPKLHRPVPKFKTASPPIFRQLTNRIKSPSRSLSAPALVIVIEKYPPISSCFPIRKEPRRGLQCITRNNSFGRIWKCGVAEVIEFRRTRACGPFLCLNNYDSKTHTTRTEGGVKICSCPATTKNWFSGWAP